MWMKYFCVIFLVFQYRSTSAITVKEYFRDIDGNLLKIKWAHAVNSKPLLDKALKDYNIKMIEADVSFDTNRKIPVMGNAPSENTEFSLEEFMKTISEFNKQILGRGVKLDFKSIDALNNSVNLINTYKHQFPIWIHGNIIKDYQVQDDSSIDAGKFLEICIPLISVQFSVGWPTPVSYSRPAPETYYTDRLVSQMNMVIRNFDASRNNMIFSVRAGLVANAHSARSIKNLLNWRYGSTLTIWSNENDYVHIAELNRLINDIGVNKVYLDVPEELRGQLVIKS